MNKRVCLPRAEGSQWVSRSGELWRNPCVDQVLKIIILGGVGLTMGMIRATKKVNLKYKRLHS